MSESRSSQVAALKGLAFGMAKLTDPIIYLPYTIRNENNVSRIQGLRDIAREIGHDGSRRGSLAVGNTQRIV